MLLLELLLGLIRFLLGAALFSFMNVVAWRLPRGMDPLKGRSVCPQCGHTLGAPDLVPVFSWFFLRGRCRHCGAHIPARYLLVELLGGVLALGCTWRYGAAYALPGGLFGMSWAALLALAVCGILLSVSLIDAETQTIPDRLNLALAVCGAVSVLLSPADWLPHVIGALCVSVPMFLLCLVIDGAFGGGDIKLMAAAGLFLGWQNTLLAMFFGRPFLAAIGLSDAALSIGGSVIVMLVAIRMVFPTQEGVFGQTPGGEPYIVPIAIPAIAGPSTLATIMMLAASEPNRLFEWGAVVVITCVVSFFVLASADWLERHMGEKLTLAFERLTGLLLAMMATQMFLGGVEAFLAKLPH